MIRHARPDDAGDVAAIYNPFVNETAISFEELPISVDDMRARIERVQRQFPWLVADVAGSVVGYAYAAPYHARAAYRFTVETTVYVGRGHGGRGIGTELYTHLIDSLRGLELQSAIGIIALPNPASVALHERVGYKKVGEIASAGKKFGRWIDVGFWQLML